MNNVDLIDNFLNFLFNMYMYMRKLNICNNLIRENLSQSFVTSISCPCINVVRGVFHLIVNAISENTLYPIYLKFNNKIKYITQVSS